VAREGLGETQPRTDRVAPDRRPRRTNDHAGGGEQAAGSQGPDRQRPPLPTRVDSLPQLPPAYDRALDAGLAAIPLAIDATARTALAAHARLLLAWNAAINLTTITNPEAVARLHVVDSLTAVPLLRERFGAAGTRSVRIVDIGSGGGYPGLAIAAAMPGAEVLAIDSTAKKVRFLEAAVDAAGLRGGRAAARAIRAEALAIEVRSGREPEFDVVTARAVGALDQLLELAPPLLRIGGVLVAWKRGAIDDELAVASRAATILGGGRATVLGVTVPGLEEHRLVVIEKRRATPPGYPREPGRRARARW
jgi:16S rRNA (guanine527-N7)-methyltransferase